MEWYLHSLPQMIILQGCKMLCLRKTTYLEVSIKREQDVISEQGGANFFSSTWKKEQGGAKKSFST